MEWTDRTELEDLDRRLRGMPSTEEAEARMADLQVAIDAQAKEMRGQDQGVPQGAQDPLPLRPRAAPGCPEGPRPSRSGSRASGRRRT